MRGGGLASRGLGLAISSSGDPYRVWFVCLS